MTKLRAGDLLLVGSFFCDLGVVVIPNPQRQRHRAQANAGLDESGDAAHCETPASAVRSAPTIPKCGGDTTLTVNLPVLSIDFVGGGIDPCMGALLRALPRGVALGMSFPRGRGIGKLIPRRSVFSCGATCS